MKTSNAATRNKPKAGVPRLAPHRGPALLLYGFRPFFLAAGIWALVAVILWIGVLRGDLVLPITADPVTWHAHELLFGYLAAAVAGFLLTAIPSAAARPVGVVPEARR